MAREDWEYEEDEDEDECDVSIKTLKSTILKRMKKADPLSEEFMRLNQRLVDITECERNETQTEQTIAQKWSWIIPTAVQSLSTMINTGLSYAMNRRTVGDILRYEDQGGIVRSGSTGFVHKPR